MLSATQHWQTDRPLITGMHYNYSRVANREMKNTYKMNQLYHQWTEDIKEFPKKKTRA